MAMEAGFEVAQEVASTGIVNREKLMQGLPDVQGNGEWMGHNEYDNVVDLLLQQNFQSAKAARQDRMELLLRLPTS